MKGTPIKVNMNQKASINEAVRWVVQISDLKFSTTRKKLQGKNVGDVVYIGRFIFEF